MIFGGSHYIIVFSSSTVVPSLSLLSTEQIIHSHRIGNKVESRQFLGRFSHRSHVHRERAKEIRNWNNFPAFKIMSLADVDCDKRSIHRNSWHYLISCEWIFRPLILLIRNITWIIHRAHELSARHHTECLDFYQSLARWAFVLQSLRSCCFSDVPTYGFVLKERPMQEIQLAISHSLMSHFTSALFSKRCSLCEMFSVKWKFFLLIMLIGKAARCFFLHQ